MADLAIPPHPTSAPHTTTSRDVIDVDSLPDFDDDVLITQVRRALPRPFPVGGRLQEPSASASSSRQDPIIIYDSDEEPPAGHNSQPGVVVPNPRAFTWEPQTNRSSQPAAPPPPQPPPAAPRSHHQPSMGLGGALIALNRQVAVEDAARRRQEEQAALPQARQTHVLGLGNITQNAFTWTESLRNMMGWGQPRQQTIRNDLWGAFEDDMDDPDWVDETFVNGLLGSEPPKPRPATSNWRPEYTHPKPPGPGFTHDFGDLDPSSKPSTSNEVVSSADEESSKDSPAALVCARCLDPLVLPAQDATKEENQLRRVWALRCGHLLDGKCVEEIMRPPPENRGGDPQDEEYMPPSKGKGRARNPSVIAVDRKGKGKAFDRGDERAVETPAEGQGPTEGSSIRSRLRPRRTGNVRTLAASQSLASISAQDSEEDDEREASQLHPTPAPAGRPVKALPRGRGAGKGAPRITKGRGRRAGYQRYRWECPVAGCGTDHVSVLGPGETEWTMDPHKGPIAVYL